MWSTLKRRLRHGEGEGVGEGEGKSEGVGEGVDKSERVVRVRLATCAFRLLIMFILSHACL